LTLFHHHGGFDFIPLRGGVVSFDFNITTALKGWVGFAPQGRGALHIIILKFLKTLPIIDDKGKGLLFRHRSACADSRFRRRLISKEWSRKMADKSRSSQSSTPKIGQKAEQLAASGGLSRERIQYLCSLRDKISAGFYNTEPVIDDLSYAFTKSVDALIA